MRKDLLVLAIIAASVVLSACQDRGRCLAKGPKYTVPMMVGKIMVPSTRRDCIKWEYPAGKPRR